MSGHHRAPASACKCCGGEAADVSLDVQETMFGMGGIFRYAVCLTCRSIWLLEPPDDLRRYYPSTYHGHRRSSAVHAKARLKFALDRAPVVILESLPFLWSSADHAFRFLDALHLDRRARLLDVGCGGGELLDKLKRAGFMRLQGIDPFVESVSTREGVEIHQCTIEEVKEQFDLVLFNHSLEHIADPRAALLKASEILAPGGHVVIRIPMLGGEVWEVSREKWVQLDARSRPEDDVKVERRSLRGGVRNHHGGPRRVESKSSPIGCLGAGHRQPAGRGFRRPQPAG